MKKRSDHVRPCRLRPRIQTSLWRRWKIIGTYWAEQWPNLTYYNRVTVWYLGSPKEWQMHAFTYSTSIYWIPSIPEINFECSKTTANKPNKNLCISSVYNVIGKYIIQTTNTWIIYRELVNVLKELRKGLRKYFMTCMRTTFLAKLSRQFISDMETFDQRC